MQEKVGGDVAFSVDRADVRPGCVRERSVQLGGLARLVVAADEQLDAPRMRADECLHRLDRGPVMIAQRDDDLTGPVALPKKRFQRATDDGGLVQGADDERETRLLVARPHRLGPQELALRIRGAFRVETPDGIQSAHRQVKAANEEEGERGHFQECDDRSCESKDPYHQSWRCLWPGTGAHLIVRAN